MTEVLPPINTYTGWKPPARSPQSVSGSRDAMALGVSLYAAHYDKTAIPGYRALTGHNPSSFMYFSTLAGPGASNFTWMLENVVPSWVVPIITITPSDYTGGASQPTYSLDTIIAGNHDAWHTARAQELAAWGRPAIIRWAHEMNGDWYPWAISAPGQGNTAAKYVQAFRRIRGLFRTAGAHNGLFAWCPNRVYANDPRMDVLPALYPGDDVVDLVALDAYNYGTTAFGPGTWDSPTVVFRDLDKLKAIAPSKPLWVMETSSVENGGSKADWIRDFAAYFKARGDVAGVVWFDEDKSPTATPPGTEVNYRVNSSTAALAAWRRYVTTDPFFGAPVSGNADTSTRTGLDVDRSAGLIRALMATRRKGETLSRLDAGSNLTPNASIVHLVGFGAEESGPKTKIKIPFGNTPSGVTVALAGLYSYDGTTFTRIAASADASASFNGVNGNVNGFTGVDVTIPSTSLVAGTYYAAAFVFVGATRPQMFGLNPAWVLSVADPPVSGSIAGTMLPATIARSALTPVAAYRVEVI